MQDNTATSPIETRSGQITGLHRSRPDGGPSSVVYRSIPFAQANRFERPTPPAPWTGVRACDAFGPTAPQVPSMLEATLGSQQLGQSEDCLTLSVFTPAADGGRRPVMVWIHGGAFVTGSGASPWYSGRQLAEQFDVVVVSINYRLNVFGFLHLDDITNGAYADTGNLGILDQIEALHWVRSHIASFGGDPANVTIFGESAGGASVASLCAAPAAIGLFHRAAAQSPALIQHRDRDTASDFAAKVLASAGLTADEARLVPAQQLLDAMTSSGVTDTQFLAPTFATTVLPYDPGVTSPTVPLLTGVTSEEWKLFALMDPSLGSLDDEGLVRRVERFGGSPALIDALRHRHPTASNGELATAAATHLFFSKPVDTWLSHCTGPTWNYVFDWKSPAMGGLLGACHAMEIPFVFDNLDSQGVELFTGNGDDRAPLGKAMSTAWASFARGGEPWERFDRDGAPTRVFGPDITTASDPFADLRTVW
jgi:para-nitrobenzyl esterase